MPLPPHAWCFARLCALWKNKAVTTGSGHSNQVLIEQSLERQILHKKSLWHCTFPESRCCEFFRPP